MVKKRFSIGVLSELIGAGGEDKTEKEGRAELEPGPETEAVEEKEEQAPTPAPPPPPPPTEQEVTQENTEQAKDVRLSADQLDVRLDAEGLEVLYHHRLLPKVKAIHIERQDDGRWAIRLVTLVTARGSTMSYMVRQPKG